MATIRRILRYFKNSLVTISRLNITDQTFIFAKQDEDINLTAGEAEVIPFNLEEADVLDELSNDGDIQVKHRGYYNIQIRAEFSVDSDQDELKLDIFNVDTGETVTENEERASGANNRNRELDATVLFETDTTYNIRATNADSDDVLNGKPKRTRLTIEPQFAAPEP